MKIRHPRAPDGEPPGIAVDVNGETVTPDDDGHYDIGNRRGWLNRYARANGVDPEALVVDEADGEDEDEAEDEDAPGTCDAVKSDGEVCGRELPCRYHSVET